MRGYFLYMILSIMICLTTINKLKAQGREAAIASKNFEGKWLFRENGKSLELILKVNDEYRPAIKKTLKIVNGYHIYTVDGVVKESSVNREPSIISGFNRHDYNNNSVDIAFIDPASGSVYNGRLTIDDKNENEMFFEIYRKEGGLEGFSTNKILLSIPNKVTLKKAS